MQEPIIKGYVTLALIEESRKMKRRLGFGTVVRPARTKINGPRRACINSCCWRTWKFYGTELNTGPWQVWGSDLSKFETWVDNMPVGGAFSAGLPFGTVGVGVNSNMKTRKWRSRMNFVGISTSTSFVLDSTSIRYTGYGSPSRTHTWYFKRCRSGFVCGMTLLDVEAKLCKRCLLKVLL